MALRDTLLLNGGSDLIGSRDFDLRSGLVSADRFGDVLATGSVVGPVPFPSATLVPEKTVIPLTSDVASIDTKNATVATQESPSIGDRIGSIFGNIWDSIKTTTEATVRGAVEGGTAASSGAAAGAQVGAQATTVGTTTLILGALLLVLLLRK